MPQFKTVVDDFLKRRDTCRRGRILLRVRYSCREDLADPLADDVGMPAK
jgi:hypothetical protein